jgi:hypothetical protein
MTAKTFAITAALLWWGPLARAQGTAFTYQGRLNDGSSPASGLYDITFTLFEATTNGNLISGPVLKSATAVSNGLFTVTLDFGTGAFDGSSRWLELAVRTNGGSAFVTLAPRQLLTPAPYAILAGVAQQTASNSVTTSSIVANAIGPDKIANGTVVRSLNGLTEAVTLSAGANVSITPSGNDLQISAGATGGSGWALNGNSGTSPNTNFLGTTDNQPLELRANNQRVLRLEAISSSLNYTGAVNHVGGSSGNFIAPGSSGSTIAGGGAITAFGEAATNSISSDFAFLGGGRSNSIGSSSHHSFLGGGQYNSIQPNSVFSVLGGGGRNSIHSGSHLAVLGGGINNSIQSNAYYSVLAGGWNNSIQPNAFISFIGGGTGNVIQTNSAYSFIGGGAANCISPTSGSSFITGGESNTNSGPTSGILGGYRNQTAGSFSLAAGHYAQALHDGCFVWSDSVNTGVKSTAANQFVIGANGGVWLQGSNTSLKVEGPASFPGGVSGYTTFNNGVQVYNGAVIYGATIYNGAAINGTINLNGYTYMNNGATIYNGASLNGSCYINNGVNISGYSYLNNGVSISGGANLYQGTYINHGLQLNGFFASGWQLYLTSQWAGKPGGGSWADTSDARIKKNIQPLTGALDKLTQLRGVTFEWINPADHADQTNVQSGFVAQDVERVFPEWVTRVSASEHDKALTADGKVRSLSLPLGYEALVVESIKELRTENLELKARVEKLEKLINALSRKME